MNRAGPCAEISLRVSGHVDDVSANLKRIQTTKDKEEGSFTRRRQQKCLLTGEVKEIWELLLVNTDAKIIRQSQGTARASVDYDQITNRLQRTSCLLHAIT